MVETLAIIMFYFRTLLLTTVKPPIKVDTPKGDKPPNKGQAEVHVFTLYRKSPLKEDNLSTKDKPKVLLHTHSIGNHL